MLKINGYILKKENEEHIEGYVDFVDMIPCQIEAYGDGTLQVRYEGNGCFYIDPEDLNTWYDAIDGTENMVIMKHWNHGES